MLNPNSIVLWIYFTKSLWVIFSHRFIRPIHFGFSVLTVQFRPMPLCHLISLKIKLKICPFIVLFFCDSLPSSLYTCSNLERIKITQLNIKAKKKKKSASYLKRQPKFYLLMPFFRSNPNKRSPIGRKPVQSGNTGNSAALWRDHLHDNRADKMVQHSLIFLSRGACWVLAESFSGPFVSPIQIMILLPSNRTIAILKLSHK